MRLLQQCPPCPTRVRAVPYAQHPLPITAPPSFMCPVPSTTLALSGKSTSEGVRELRALIPFQGHSYLVTLCLLVPLLKAQMYLKVSLQGEMSLSQQAPPRPVPTHSIPSPCLTAFLACFMI